MAAAQNVRAPAEFTANNLLDYSNQNDVNHWRVIRMMEQS
jgi:hypothetical protein